MDRLKRLTPSQSALVEVGLLFLPAIPAYLWMWPRLSGTANDVVQAVVYVYVLAGTLIIGLRRWSWDQLGANRKGLALAGICTLLILGGRLIIILTVNWGAPPGPLTPWRLAWLIFYYFLLVGLVEELLFRGLLYRLLEDWGGVRWAIWGSSFGFMLWHIFGQGVTSGIATFFIGLAFALIRWRAGGIIGLIVLHALWDLQGSLLVPDTVVIQVPAAVTLPYPALTWVGFLIMVAPVVWLIVFPLSQFWERGKG